MFCNHCGGSLQPGQVFCPGCGQPAPAVPAARPGSVASRVSRHINALAILWILFSGLRLLRAGSLFLFSGLRRFSFGPIWASGPSFLPSILPIFGTLSLIMAVAGLIVGWGLMGRHLWARPLALVLGALALLSFPFGTILGIYTLLILLPGPAEQEYRAIARP